MRQGPETGNRQAGHGRYGPESVAAYSALRTDITAYCSLAAYYALRTPHPLYAFRLVGATEGRRRGAIPSILVILDLARYPGGGTVCRAE